MVVVAASGAAAGKVRLLRLPQSGARPPADRHLARARQAADVVASEEVAAEVGTPCCQPLSNSRLTGPALLSVTSTSVADAGATATASVPPDAAATDVAIGDGQTGGDGTNVGGDGQDGQGNAGNSADPQQSLSQCDLTFWLLVGTRC